MKKNYLFICLACLSIIFKGFTQQTVQMQELGSIPFDNPLNYGLSNAVQAKTTACALDTVQYTLAKATGLNALNINNTTSGSAAANYFDAPQAITVSGLEFYAYAINQPNINVTVSLFLAGADSLPAGAALASTVVAVDSTFGGGALNILRKEAIFTTPVTVNAPYLLVVENDSPDQLGLICTDYNVGDGMQEWLSSIIIGVNWVRSYDVNVGGPTFDADWLFHPLVNYDLSASFSASSQCLGQASNTITFTNNSSGVLFNRMYNQAAFQDLVNLSSSWDFGDGSPRVFAQDTSHTYTITGLVAVNLTDTLYAWTGICFDDTSLQLVDEPIAGYAYSANSLQVSFTDTSTNLSANGTWMWDYGDGTTSTMQNPTHTYSAGGVYTACLTVGNECGTNTTCQTLLVDCDPPESNFTFTSDAYTASFTSTTTNLFGGSLVWDFGNGNNSFQTNPNHIYDTTGIYTVCLIANSPCGSDTACQTVTIECNNPVVDFTGSSVGYELTIANNSSAAGGASYTWYFGDGTTSNLENPGVHIYANTGQYNVCLAISDVCGVDSSCQTIDIVCNAPVVDFNSQLTGPTSYLFTDNSSVTGTAIYAWDFGDGSTSSNQDEDHSYSSAGTYTACLTVTDDCGTDSSCAMIDVVLGISDFADAGIEIFPNPSSGIFNIELNAKHIGAELEVYDVLGRSIHRQFIQVKNIQLSMNEVPKGVYFIQVIKNNQLFVQKILLE